LFKNQIAHKTHPVGIIMPPKKGGGGGPKKGELWEGILIQKLSQVRAGLAGSGVLPATRNNDGYTTFHVASMNGLDKSLAEMVRWYERRDRELRICLEVCDEDMGRSPLHMACAGGHTATLKVLLDACGSIDRNNSFANTQLARKDSNGKTPLALAIASKKQACVDLIEEFTHVSSEEEGGAEEGGAEELTSTQLNKLKKLALIEKETGVRRSLLSHSLLRAERFASFVISLAVLRRLPGFWDEAWYRTLCAMSLEFSR